MISPPKSERPLMSAPALAVTGAACLATALALTDAAVTAPAPYEKEPVAVLLGGAETGAEDTPAAPGTIT
ncbi:MAG: hypothetical protein M3229_01105 [Actinomycetota bacterium]|nr:hypothetical protein [Actinomycetota bacterium]